MSPIAPRALVYFFIFGLFLTLRGYHSRDGDQAYRLPLLLHRQDPTLFADDPFVQAFDTFNPHRGYLALLDVASRPLGLSAGLAALFALTFAVTCFGLDRLAHAVWPEAGPRVGVVAVVLVLIAKAGNIGTNHLFEAMLLDRLVGFALGWIALALAVERPERGRWGAPLVLGAAILVHPSVGLQLGMLLGAGWIGWALWPGGTGVDWRRAATGLSLLVLALVPGVAMNLGHGAELFRGLPTEEFRLLSVELQGPQHMLPHLWRLPQWLAWGCYPILAFLALRSPILPEALANRPAPRVRLAFLLAINLAGLGLAWVAVEVVRDLGVTLFQPFRMATILRGLALVSLSGRVLGLWRRAQGLDRCRAVLLAVGLAGDWSLVIATLFDVTLAVLEGLRARPAIRGTAGVLVLAGSLFFLSRHDTESGHLPLLAALGVGAISSRIPKGRLALRWNRRRVAWAMVVAWAVPMAALLAGALAPEGCWARALSNRCRFSAIPSDDIERLAAWCRDHTPASARFIGPPGPKTFRLWSLRNLAFNRAGSPYHAAGLADWSARFRDHVGFDGAPASFVRAYLADRHALERRYQAMSPREHAELAARQGASYVVATPPTRDLPATAQGPLELLHVEGRYAVYRVRTPERVARQRPSETARR